MSGNSSKENQRKICMILAIIWSLFILVSIVPFGIWTVLYAPDLNSVAYYSNSKNYVTFDGNVKSFFIGEDYIGIEFDHSQKEFYNDFKIRGKSFDLAVKNGLPDILQEGISITITSASAYLGDGWAYPIVAVTYNGIEIIPYEEGKQNFIEVQQSAENRAKLYITILGSVVGVLLVFDICAIIGIFLQRKNELTVR